MRGEIDVLSARKIVVRKYPTLQSIYEVGFVGESETECLYLTLAAEQVGELIAGLKNPEVVD